MIKVTDLKYVTSLKILKTTSQIVSLNYLQIVSLNYLQIHNLSESYVYAEVKRKIIDSFYIGSQQR